VGGGAVGAKFRWVINVSEVEAFDALDTVIAAILRLSTILTSCKSMLCAPNPMRETVNSESSDLLMTKLEGERELWMMWWSL
jgi:hypothetical protein